ncbi:hypothetical protein DTO013E5_8753 [Penicillium roqueforti]|nr:uncharacterized protein LCP9604111_8397 [Penicillium roqueforti]KAF9241454.1 hypothetical protein LCP9604111_8397 [Penicillium roqueforti]KAI1830364.1 hypothetical protein CBS147337_8831 [Penicillium roqueforti]KAI2670890.1 hypothetical protein CBS147355_9002 [Penicillium roqueforti]KAI2674629.1 hypothetical protein LCP963914a_8779 [Penicillium roqueforti]KAI2696308.1 hypothetical protein CBS147372_8566 [Penicillium roqueforti]
MKCKSKKALKCFMQKGWDINERISDLDPPVLNYAIYEEEMTNWLLDHGANPNQRCDINCTPLSYAVQLALINIIELMLSRGGDVQQGQLLQYAIYRRTNLNEVLALLIDKGAPLNVPMYQDYPTFRRFYPVSLGTPLHIATELGKLDAIRFLLGRGADTNIEDGNGCTVIEWARNLNQTEIARLLENGH